MKMPLFFYYFLYKSLSASIKFYLPLKSGGILMGRGRGAQPGPPGVLGLLEARPVSPPAFLGLAIGHQGTPPRNQL